jgi:tetratricopeptide (TPR) repeat protein
MAARQRRPLEQTANSGSLYRALYQIGAGAFVLAFAMGLGYSLSTSHALPPITDDFGWDRLVTAQDADAMIHELQMYLQIGPVGDVLSAGATAGYHVWLGQIYESKGALAQAVDSYRAGLALYEKSSTPQPGQAEAYYLLAAALAAQGQREAARQQLQQALKIRPDWAEAQQSLRSLEDAGR